VDDLAELAVAEGSRTENTLINAIGPEAFTYRELVDAVGAAIGRKRIVLGVPPGLGYVMSCLVGWCMRDRFVTRDEIKGLMAGSLCVEAPPAGTTRMTEWMRANRDTLGRRYASELGRRRDRRAAYAPAA
jgi:NADH dehydrogenase